ncbi:MAG: hypothetical protein II121_07560 [Fibrobacter sp.]|uniref:hypothetical protein n=1 Tax=uncultured Fibrobacter sp. TaxID=261512 RepID=UPI001565D7D2|nr:hypothetical protein [uncultured Fibrobacter sp.]MBQ1824978.1 hypothetical protein [Fibrobacter sp.]
MKNWFKILSTLLVASSMAFAQFGYDDEDASDSAEETSYSYGNDESADEDEASSEANVGKAKASGDEWEGFRYEEMGLTQWEFQQIKEAGISRDKLTRIVELGVRPSEYLQKPWEKMKISEEAWLAQRSEGMEDADIDRSYRNHHGDQSYAYLSLLVPSLYQWKKGDLVKATFIDAVWIAGVATTVYLKIDKNSSWFYALIPVIGAHIYSFADAFFGTQWDSNPDANRFSFGVLPTPDKGVAGILQMKF